jgi:hypothetical protein
MSGYAEDADKL